MPRKKPAIDSYPITRFTGIETKYSPIDQKLGTLKKADGTNVVPLGQLSFGPNWQYAFNLSTFAAQITAALSGADVTKVHFVTVAKNGCTFLVAWDLKNARPQGIWQVIGEGNPFVPSSPDSVVTPGSQNHTESITFTGATGTARTVTLLVNGALSQPGDRIVIEASFPATLGFTMNFYSLTKASTALATISADGVDTTATLEFVLNASYQWEYLTAKSPA
jgi:hypothetical protein